MDEILNSEKDLDKAESSLIVTLQKPFIFEQKEYTKFDLSPLEDFTLEDYSKILKQYARIFGSGSDVVPEYELDFALIVAEKILAIPRSAIGSLYAKDAVKLRLTVMRFFLE